MTLFLIFRVNGVLLMKKTESIRGAAGVKLHILFFLILILIVIAIPHVVIFQEKRQFNKYARIYDLASAIEAYYQDNNTYPPMIPLVQYSQNAETVHHSGGWVTATVDFSLLTTPVRYIKKISHDPYAPEKGLPFCYYVDGTVWILYSAGPDRDYDFIPRFCWRDVDAQPSDALLISATYDPSNGLKSSGDLWVIKQ